MRLAAATALVLVVGLAGCIGGGGSRQPRTLTAGSISLPRLPAQGLIDEERHGVALRDLRGRRLAWLPDFAVYPPGAPNHPSAAWAFLLAGLRPPLLHGPQGWYRLDAARHALLPVGGRLPLAGGATVLARGGQSVAATFAVQRGGRTTLRGTGMTFRVLSQRLVQARRTLLDVGTGRRWELPPGCLPAGHPGETLILACGVGHGAEAAARLVLERLAPGGAIRRLTPPLAQLIPEETSLSPDGRWVAVEGDTGCAASYVYIAPARGAAARIVYGPSLTEPTSPNSSTLLRWS